MFFDLLVEKLGPGIAVSMASIGRRHGFHPHILAPGTQLKASMRAGQLSRVNDSVR